jgi:hypothetical protein
MKLDDTYLRPDVDETRQARLHDRFHCPAH